MNDEAAETRLGHQRSYGVLQLAVLNCGNLIGRSWIDLAVCDAPH